MAIRTFSHQPEGEVVRPSWPELSHSLRSELDALLGWGISALVHAGVLGVLAGFALPITPPPEEDGRIADPTIEESSGHASLDWAAPETLAAAVPLSLEYPLNGHAVVMLIPLHYQLE